MNVNHAPLGAMLRHRSRHQQTQKPGQENKAVNSIYPLARDTRFNPKSLDFDEKSSQGSKKMFDFGLPPVIKYNKVSKN